MRKIGILISIIVILLMFRGCGSETTYWQNWEAPNWTSDGKVIFIKDSNYVKIAHGAMGSEQWNVEGSKEVLTLCEINSDGTGYTEKGVLLRSEDYAYALDVTGLSSAGNWVTFGIEGLHIYVASRDGTSAEEIGEGTYPDFSPDASQIVYEKPDNGIWIMDRDGGNDHQIIANGRGVAWSPAWSPDGGRIAYVIGYPNVDTLLVIDTLGILLNNFFVEIDMPDWGPLDSNAVSGSGGGYARIVYYDSGNINNSSNVPAGWGGS
jgi:hypothetical protein